MVQDSTSMLTMSESEGRKWSKPVMEKRRRERINKSLEELKLLVLQAQRRDSSRYARLEKADILEMTVQHLRTIRNRSISSSQHLSRTTLRGIHFGCHHCSPLTDLVTMETRQAASRHLPIAPKPNQYVTPMKCNSNAQQIDLVPSALSPPSLGNLSHQNTAVQCIPLWQDGMRNSCLSIPESSGELWRPF